MKELKLFLVIISAFLGLVALCVLYGFSQKYSASIYYNVLPMSPGEYKALEGETMNFAKNQYLKNPNIELKQYIKDDSFIIELKRNVGKDNYQLRAIFPILENTMELSEGTIKNELNIDYDKVEYFHLGDTYAWKSFVFSCALAFCLEVILQIIVYKIFENKEVVKKKA